MTISLSVAVTESHNLLSLDVWTIKISPPIPQFLCPNLTVYLIKSAVVVPDLNNFTRFDLFSVDIFEFQKINVRCTRILKFEMSRHDQMMANTPTLEERSLQIHAYQFVLTGSVLQ